MPGTDSFCVGPADRYLSQSASPVDFGGALLSISVHSFSPIYRCNLFSQRPFDWLLSIFMPIEFCSCILSSVDFSIWRSLVVMKTKNVFLQILTYYKHRQRKKENRY